MDEAVVVHQVVFHDGRPSDARFLYVNRSYRELLQLPGDHPPDCLLSEAFGPGGREALVPFLAAFESGKAQRFEHYSSRLGRWLVVLATPFRPDRLLTIFFDITERKQAELDLERANSFNQALIDSIPGIVYVYDSQLRLIRWNKQHETLTGFTAEELYLKDGDSWFDDQEKPFIQQSRERITTSLNNIVRANLICKSGERKPFLLTAVRSEIDSEFLFLGVGIELTELVRAEKDKAELERQLIESQKLETVGRLAGGVAHDFNNLLTVIDGYAQLMMPQLAAGPLRHSAQQISKAAARAADLTSQLLAFSRRQIIQPRPLDLNAAVRETEDMMRRLIGEDIQLATVLDPQLGRVLADPGQVHQILMNLVANARDAMPHGGNLLIETANVEFDEQYVKTHAETAPGHCVLLAVSDTGVGMSHDVRQKVFEPFFTTKEKGRGTGLGLATVYGIVRQSGGWIWVYSEPGQGTTFKIYFPRIEHPGAGTARAATPTLARMGTETILLVEDQEAVRELERTILESNGYQVLTAPDGETAIHLAETHPGAIALLLTDVVLPGMNGRQLADRIHSSRPDVSVLFSSGYTDNVIAHRGVLKPGVFYLAKPFSPDALLAKVREVLGTQSGAPV